MSNPQKAEAEICDDVSWKTWFVASYYDHDDT